MKKQISEIFGRKMIFGVLLLSALAFFAVSCEKDDSVALADVETAEAEFNGPDLKRGRPAQAAPARGSESIAAIAIDAEFTELVGALVYVDAELEAGLVDLFLNGTDQYTVFAPTNEAFEALYEALEIDEISDLPADLVLNVLLYHVAEGRRAANSVVPPVRTRTITTLLGKTFSVNSQAEITDLSGQTAEIVAANISASNGIIHVIDTVLLPLE